MSQWVICYDRDAFLVQSAGQSLNWLTSIQLDTERVNLSVMTKIRSFLHSAGQSSNLQIVWPWRRFAPYMFGGLLFESLNHSVMTQKSHCFVLQQVRCWISGSFSHDNDLFFSHLVGQCLDQQIIQPWQKCVSLMFSDSVNLLVVSEICCSLVQRGKSLGGLFFYAENMILSMACTHTHAHTQDH